MREDVGVLGFGISPRFAIGQRALLAETLHGSVLWDCVSMVTDEAVAEIGRRGGLRAIAISRPHFLFGDGGLEPSLWRRAGPYSRSRPAMGRLRPDPAIRFWEGEGLVLNPLLTLVRCGWSFRRWANRCIGNARAATPCLPAILYRSRRRVGACPSCTATPMRFRSTHAPSGP